MIKDYENYDYFSVSVRSAQANGIKECYRALGWSEVKAEDDRDYSDMKYMLYSRPRNIENKDRLQYLQVRMENSLNSVSERWVKRYSKSTAIAVFLGVLGSAFIGLGLWIFFAFSHENYLWLSIFAECLGIACYISLVYPLVFVRRAEKKEVRKKGLESLALIKTLIGEAASLSGVVPALPKEVLKTADKQEENSAEVEVK